MTEENILDGVASIKPPGKSKRHFERGTPKDALTWKTGRQRSRRLWEWQLTVSVKFATRARPLRVAWLVYLLCQKEGYCWATDKTLGEWLNMPVNKVQQALKDLEDAGAIVRASSFVAGKPERHVWPSAKIIPPAVGGMDTPRDDRVDTPRSGGRDSIETTRARKTSHISTTAQAARRDAERREDQHSRQPEADYRGAPEAPRRLAPIIDVVLEAEIVVDRGVGLRPPPDPSNSSRTHIGA